MFLILENLREGLSALGLQPGMTVMTHSSLSSFGTVDGGGVTVIRALREVLTEAGTLLMPAFTLYNLRRGNEAFVFDPAVAESDVGIIPETFRKMPGVVRSVHPTHSAAVCGAARSRYAACPSMTAWGTDSPFRMLCNDGGYILLLGVSFKCCTLGHYVEEQMQVPYRRYWSYPHAVISRPDGLPQPCTQRVFGPERSGSNFIRLHELMMNNAALRQGQIGEAVCYLLPACEIVRVMTEKIAVNPDYFAADR